MQIKELYAELSKGDRSRIANTLNCSESYVEKLLLEKRPVNTALAKSVISISTDLVHTKQSIIDKYGISGQ